MKLLFSFLILTISMSSFAQQRGFTGGRIDLGGGRSTVRVDIGPDRTDINQNERIRRLEEAVRDLQYQVYDLRDQPQTTIIRTNVCSLRTSFDGTFIGKGQSRVEAEAQALNKCRAAQSLGCNSKPIMCEVVEEVVSIR